MTPVPVDPVGHGASVQLVVTASPLLAPVGHDAIASPVGLQCPAAHCTEQTGSEAVVRTRPGRQLSKGSTISTSAA